MHVINLAGASSVKNPRTEVVHEAGSDGVFRDIPLDFAHELVTRHASHWREESAHEAAQHAAAVEELRNPHVLPKAVADLRGRADTFEARIAALEAHIGREALGFSEEPDATSTDAVSDTAEPGAEKPAPARKTAAAKTTASKRTAAAPKGAGAKPKSNTPDDSDAASAK